MKMIITFGRNNETRRLRWLSETLARVTPSSRLLDAGAGELRNKAFCGHVRYVSQDLCQYEGKGDGHALQMNTWNTTGIDIVSDITAIPEPNESFDVILCTEVLEHLPDPLAAVKEFARLLKPDGTLIITAPFCSLTHFAPYHFCTGFSRYWYQENLKRMGLRIVELKPNGSWLDYIAQELWRLPWIGRTYVNRFLGWVALLFCMPAFLVIWLMSKLDRGSSELLCFGWQVVAKRDAVPNI